MHPIQQAIAAVLLTNPDATIKDVFRYKPGTMPEEVFLRLAERRRQIKSLKNKKV